MALNFFIIFRSIGVIAGVTFFGCTCKCQGSAKSSTAFGEVRIRLSINAHQGVSDGSWETRVG